MIGDVCWDEQALPRNMCEEGQQAPEGTRRKEKILKQRPLKGA